MTKKERQIIIDHMNTDAIWLARFRAEGNEENAQRHLTNVLRLRHLAEALGMDVTYEIVKANDPIYGEYNHYEYREV